MLLFGCETVSKFKYIKNLNGDMSECICSADFYFHSPKTMPK